MKRILLFGILILCLSCVMPASAQADENEETVVTAAQFIEKLPDTAETKIKYLNSKNVNIRDEPNIDSEILGKTEINTSFEVVLELNGWSMVLYKDSYAYIYSSYLSDTKTPQYKYLGNFKISHYCCEKYKHICGTGTGKTATGLDVQPGMISVDPRIIPLGSIILINGVEYVAEDTGGMIKGKKIDMAVLTHQEAINLGVYYADIYIKEN